MQAGEEMTALATQPMLFDHVDGPTGELVVDYVNYATAKQPCMEWHYAKKCPNSLTYSFGVWEYGLFRGVLAYGSIASDSAHVMFGIDNKELLELKRIALRGHDVPLTQIISATVAKIRMNHQCIQLILSYADPNAGHHGGIYQAASWTYLGTSVPDKVFHIGGKHLHSRTITDVYPTSSLEWIRENVDSNAFTEPLPPKHKYAFGLNRRMRKLLATMAQTLSERCKLMALVTATGIIPTTLTGYVNDQLACKLFAMPPWAMT